MRRFTKCGLQVSSWEQRSSLELCAKNLFSRAGST
jgi:hypothetical protein